MAKSTKDVVLLDDGFWKGLWGSSQGMPPSERSGQEGADAVPCGVRQSDVLYKENGMQVPGVGTDSTGALASL